MIGGLKKWLFMFSPQSLLLPHLWAACNFLRTRLARERINICIWKNMELAHGVFEKFHGSLSPTRKCSDLVSMGLNIKNIKYLFCRVWRKLSYFYTVDFPFLHLYILLRFSVKLNNLLPHWCKKYFKINLFIKVLLFSIINLT